MSRSIYPFKIKTVNLILEGDSKMPYLTSARIVNFKYNHDAIVIDDSTLEFTLSGAVVKGSRLPSTLLYLRNGGGKSTLFLILRQAVKCTAGGTNQTNSPSNSKEENDKEKKIEDYFQVKGNHGFVVLEWQKDNSNEKILTGISIRKHIPKETSQEEKDNGKVDYYYFLAEYEDNSAQNPYSLKGLELSNRNFKSFVPAHYDYVRDLAIKSSGQIKCFNSSDTAKYHEALEPYGIPNMMVVSSNMCASETGVYDYFKKFSSQTLLEDYLIKELIEKKVSASNSKPDGTLKELANKYVLDANAKSSLREEGKAYRACTKDIEQIATELDDKLILEDKERNIILSEILGLQNALKEKIKNDKAEFDSNETLCDELEQRTTIIRCEEQSYKFHQENDKLTQREKDRITAQELCTSIDEKIKILQHKQDLLRCAELFEHKKELSGECEALDRKIKLKESGSNEAVLLKNLRYSVKEKLHPILEKVRQDLETTQEEELNINKEKNAKEKILKETITDLSKKNEEKDCAKGALMSYKEETDSRHEELKIGGTRNLEGLYSIQAVECNASEKKKALEFTIKNIEKSNNRKNEIETSKTELTNEYNDLITETSRAQVQLEHKQKDFLTYQNNKKEITEILDDYKKALHDIYNSSFLLRLESNIQEKKGLIECCQKDIACCKKDIENIKNNVYYYEDEIIESIRALNIPFQTGEDYVSSYSKNSGEEKTKELLSRHPELVYSIIFDNKKQKETLFKNFSEDITTHSIIPVFTLEELDSAINDATDNSGKFLYSFKEEILFSGKETVLADLKTHIEEAEGKIKNFNLELEKYQNDKENICDFKENYNEGWEEEVENAIRTYEYTIDKNTSRLKKIKEEKDKLSNEEKDIINKIWDLNNEKKEIESWTNKCEELRSRILKEQKDAAKLEKLQQECENLREEIEKVEKEIEKITEKKKEISKRKEQLASKIENIEEKYKNVKDSNKAELLDGAWEELYQQYVKIRALHDAEITDLNSSLDSQRKKLDKVAKELSDTMSQKKIEECEYKELHYSGTQMLEYEKEEKTQIDNKENADTILLDIEKEITALSTKLEGIKEALEKITGHETQPLPKDQVSTNLKEIQERLKNTKRKKEAIEEKNKQLDKTIQNLKDTLSRIQEQNIETPPGIAPKQTEIMNADQQWKDSLSSLKNKNDIIRKNTNKIVKTLEEKADVYKEKTDASKTLLQLARIIRDTDEPTETFKFAYDNLVGLSDTCEKKASQIEADLSNLTKAKKNLIDQCLIQAEMVHRELLQISDFGKLNLNGKRITGLKINVARVNEIQRDAAKARIEALIDEMERDACDMIKLGKNHMRKIDTATNSASLLYRYLNTNYIPIELYKFDAIKQNCKTYDFSKFKSSTGEATPSYSLLLMICLHYMASTSGISSVQNTATLLVDNPFGSTSARHLTEPFMEMARQYGVQLISCTGHNDHAIHNLFDIVIPVKIEPAPGTGKYVFINTLEDRSSQSPERFSTGRYSVDNKEASDKLLDEEQLSLFKDEEE